ncbi:MULTISPECIES: four helix bundle protein [Sphingobacterium]|uniref:four helix bundle protein n=1 Tax=Sphingobacterium TaxID=28453 RepID=UPI00104B9F44|nr:MULTISPECIES: four helix bundle protein [Sphingobacterium]MCW2262413.1 four helix bundle protein [Sphingobacterium kitahiroshimense]NJI74690.1 four helix bundle protein [Sphingobacterium sp. B16(2022)]TCR12839.1 four helix bundle protein [Sphingobacterium sp. JUb78]
MHNLKELKIWSKSIELATKVYEVVSLFPSEEKFGLSSQIKRSVISIASNIAEGAGRNSGNEFIHFLGIANGSSFELQTQIIIAQNLKLLKVEQAEQLCSQIIEIQKMIFGFLNKLKNDNK